MIRSDLATAGLAGFAVGDPQRVPRLDQRVASATISSSSWNGVGVMRSRSVPAARWGS